MGASKLFKKDIAPACEYCEFGKNTQDEAMVECKRSGLVSPYFRCNRFKYSPVRRVPRQTPKLPKMKVEDFKL